MNPVQKALRIVAVVAMLLAVVAVRVVLASRGELQQGDALREAGDPAGAIVHYRRAAKWYAPGNPFCVEAMDALAGIAGEVEAEQPELALSAWRSIRGALMGARSFYVPHPERLAMANDHIATLMAHQPAPPIDAGKSPEELRAEHLALLEQMPGPSLGWTLVLLFGFFVWVGSAFALATKGFDAEGRVQRLPAMRFGALIAFGFGLFVLGLRFA